VSESQQDGWEPAQVAQLRVGQYIRIDHRWFDHPFVRRMFRISSEKELQVLRERAPTRVFVRQEQPAGEPAPVEVVDMRNQRDGLAAAQARMREALQRAQLAYSALGYGDPNAASILDELVDFLVALLNNSTAPLALLANSLPGVSSQRIALLGSDSVSMAAVIGKRMGLPRDELRQLTRAAAAHVAGLTRLPANLVDEDADGAAPRDPLFLAYPALGAKILEQCGGFPDSVVRIVREHRERPDGRGFPQSLPANSIHPHALILGAIREFQIRCSGGRSQVASLAYLNKHLRPVYGAEIIGHLTLSVLIYPVGAYVQLSDGRLARIVRSEEATRVSPVVEAFQDVNSLSDGQTIDLAQRRDLAIVRVLDTSWLPPKMFAHGKRTVAIEGTAASAAAAGNGVPVPETPRVVVSLDEDVAARA
jgi:hypothetical protein